MWRKRIMVLLMAAIGSGSVSVGQAMEIKGSVPGNGSDNSQATYHFDDTNMDFQMTKPDGSALDNSEVPYYYGNALKILSGSKDVVVDLDLQVQGARLTNADWTSLRFPAKNTVAVDAESGRFKFSPIGSWQGAQGVDGNLLMPSLTYKPRVAMNDSGLAVCVYDIADSFGNTPVYASIYSPSTGWGEVEMISVDQNGNTLDGRNPEVAINSSGRIFCVFEQDYPGPTQVCANWYTPGQGWYYSVTLDAALGTGANPQIAVNNNGQAIVAYEDMLGGVNRIFTRRYNPSIGAAGHWYSAVSIQATTWDTDCEQPQVAMDNSGNAVVVFIQEDGSGNLDLFANRYLTSRASSYGWEVPVDIDNNLDYDVSNPRVAMNDAGRIVCVFQQSDDDNERIYSRVYDNGWATSWQTLDSQDVTFAASSPDLAMNAAGQAVCALVQVDGTAVRVYANRYQPGIGWYGAVSIDAKNGADADSPAVAISGEGKMVCLFTQGYGAIVRAFANVYTPGFGWQGAEIISHPEHGSITEVYMDVAMDYAGRAWGVFSQDLATVSSFRFMANNLLNSIPYAGVSVNYYEADAVATATPVPTQNTLEIRGRKIEPLRGEQTTIEFNLAQGGAVSIKVYNLRGELVATLADQYYAAGSYSLAWAAQNAGGSLVSSGVYVVHMKLPFETKTQKVVVIK